ncbi:MAG: hypothetical protein PHD61_05365 [Bacteroidales bacterium]|nr:hypothetical protein [Lentimicrobiaceae bacterium]MDD5694714.1 hypothetical protein [Bacteroidales bacterium]
MIIHFYRKQFNSQLIVFVLASILLWVDAFLFPMEALHLSFQTPLYSGLVILLEKVPAHLHVILAFLILVAEAILLNSSMVNHKIIARNTLLPFLLYFVLMSYSPVIQTIHPVMIANFFLILSLNVNMSIYLKPEPYREIFNGTFLISMASLFYLPSLIFLFLFWLSLIIYRISSLREWIVTISGLIAPYIFVAFYYYWTDSFSVFLEDYVLVMFRFIPFTLGSLKPWLGELYIALGIVIFILLIIGLIKLSLETTEKVITVRKRMNVIIYWTIISIISFFWAGDHLLIHATILAVPACILIAYFFSGIRRIAVAELSFTILIILIAAIKLFFRVEA